MPRLRATDGPSLRSSCSQTSLPPPSSFKHLRTEHVSSVDPSSMTMTLLTHASARADWTALSIVFALLKTATSTSTQADLLLVSRRIGPNPVDCISCRKLCGFIRYAKANRRLPLNLPAWTSADEIPRGS